MKKRIKPCPNCGRSGKRAWINRIVTNAILPTYFIECSGCHWCGETKVFLWRAINAWNFGVRRIRKSKTKKGEKNDQT